MFDNLSEKLERSFKVLKGQGRITEINVAETVKEIRKALSDADVNYKVAKQFTDTVKQQALGQNVLTSVKPGELLIKIVHDELIKLMGGSTAELQLNSRPARNFSRPIFQTGDRISEPGGQICESTMQRQCFLPTKAYQSMR